MWWEQHEKKEYINKQLILSTFIVSYVCIHIDIGWLLRSVSSTDNAKLKINMQYKVKRHAYAWTIKQALFVEFGVKISLWKIFMRKSDMLFVST